MTLSLEHCHICLTFLQQTSVPSKTILSVAVAVAIATVVVAVVAVAIVVVVAVAVAIATDRAVLYLGTACTR
jgi:hypothetical protein